MIRLLPILAVPLLLPGCRSAANGEGDREILRIDVVEPVLLAGTSAEVQLENLSDRTIGFNLCPKVVERGDGSSWTPLPETRLEACTLELYVLAAGETTVQTIEIPAGLEPGTHRVVFEGISFEQGDPAIPPAERASDSFEIQ
ncbi:MAG: immunoglobulin-like domain-containing protein [Gemmatimonadota bacterium]